MSWAQDFVKVFGGYIDNPHATAACRYCQYKIGEEFSLPLNMKYSLRWRDAFIGFSFFGTFVYLHLFLSMLMVFTVFNLALTTSKFPEVVIYF